MEFAIVKVPLSPVRRKPKHQSEMTNQLLFGDAVKVLKQKGPLWVKVRSLFDAYEGWITRTHLQEVAGTEAKAPANYVTADLLNKMLINGQVIHVPAGASLPFFNEGKGRLGDLVYSFEGRSIKADEQAPHPEQVKALTMAWLNAPYLWGGKSILGVDCSGFVQTNFKMMGVRLLRDAWQQAQQGRTVDKLKHAICGDLAFFDDKDEIVHVGILLDSERIIHSSGMVRIDEIDKKGIIHSETGKRTHSLRVIKHCW